MTPLKQILTACMLLLASFTHAQMVLEYDIAIANTQITLPLAGTVNVSVNWGDGSALETFSTRGDKPHTFATIGTKTVTITGTLTAYGSNTNLAGSAKLTKVLSWDGLGLTSLQSAFYGAEKLIQVPLTLPSTVTDLSYMFQFTPSFNQAIGGWNTAAVTNMKGLFYACSSFNQPIGDWNTAAVTDMSAMFAGSHSFNQPIGNWNTAAVTNMAGMFQSAITFNHPIGDWNTKAVTNMSDMFDSTLAFNQPIGNWNTAAVTDMRLMFRDTKVFNQPIGAWNTAAVTDMSDMFADAQAFNQSIEAWNTAAVTSMRGMFWGTSTFNQPIGAWNTAAVTNMSYMFQNAKAFNQSIGAWNTAAVTNMTYIFCGAIAFNQPIGTWNTAALTDMRYMFSGAVAFNQPIGTWNTAGVSTMSHMFDGALSFNQPLGAWNTAAVNYMDYMFSGAIAFNQPLGAWKINTSFVYMYYMFHGAGLCTDNYDNLLNGWAPQAVKTGVYFDGGNSNYSSASASARDTLISKGWTITDAGLGTTTNAKCITTAVEEEFYSPLGTTLYPNPVKDRLAIHLGAPYNEMITYTIINAAGRFLLEKETQPNGLDTEIELGHLPQGVYFLKMKTIHTTSVHAFVKE